MRSAFLICLSQRSSLNLGPPPRLSRLDACSAYLLVWFPWQEPLSRPLPHALHYVWMLAFLGFLCPLVSHLKYPPCQRRKTIQMPDRTGNAEMREPAEQPHGDSDSVKTLANWHCSYSMPIGEVSHASPLFSWCFASSSGAGCWRDVH